MNGHGWIGDQRLKDLIAPGKDSGQIRLAENLARQRRVRIAGNEVDAARIKRPIHAGPDKDPRARIAAFMHGVIHQADVAPDGNAFAGGPQVSFRANGVLKITEVISDVSE